MRIPNVHSSMLRSAAGLCVLLVMSALASAADMAKSGGVLVAAPKLTFAKINSQKMTWTAPGPTRADIYRDYEKIIPHFLLQTPYADAFEWRWQVSTQPFPKQASLSAPGIVAQGPMNQTAFTINLTSFPPLGASKTPSLKSASTAAPVKPVPLKSSRAQTRRAATFSNADRPASGLYYVPLVIDAPVNLYVRVVALSNGKPAGPPSNTVIAHYKLGSSPQMKKVKKSFEWAAKLKQMQGEAKMFQVKVTSFTPARFPDEVGCVVIKDNPHQGKQSDVFAGYLEGQTYCPPDDPKLKGKDKGFFDYFVEGLKGYAFAYDKLVEFYDDAKAFVVEKFVSLVPCDMAGEKAAQYCKEGLTTLGEGALTVGLAAAGVPPSLPDMAALTELGKGKVVDAAVEFTCDRAKEHGSECSPAMREQLANVYKMGIDEMQKQLTASGTEPECGQSLYLKEIGKLPLPCFGDHGIKVVAAAGAFYRPPLVKLDVTRIKPQPAYATACVISTGLHVTNKFPGGYVGGVMTSAKNLQGEPFYPAASPVPELAVGETKPMTLALTTQKPFSISANNSSASGIYQEWLALYLRSSGQLTTSSVTTEMTINDAPVQGACSDAVTIPVTIP